jgi:hypothetical protein
MRLTVVYENGTWEFSVASDEEGDDYLEVFELSDLREAQDAAWDLMEEISKVRYDPFNDLFDESEEDD